MPELTLHPTVEPVVDTAGGVSLTTAQGRNISNGKRALGEYRVSSFGKGGYAISTLFFSITDIYCGDVK